MFSSLLDFVAEAEVDDSSVKSIFCCSTNFDAAIIIRKILFKSD